MVDIYPKVSNAVNYHSMNISHLLNSLLKNRGRAKLARNLRTNLDDARRI
jgi:hypothetical protein